MNLGQLRKRARAETRDLVDPFNWSDEEWRNYFNEAADEAAIRGRLIEDDSITTEVSAGDSYADYPEYVWAIQRVFLGTKRMVLVDRELLDATEGEGWEDRAGAPWACYEINGQLRFYPTPDISGSARIVGLCTPKDPMQTNSDEPGLRGRIHIHLLDWALHLAYSKKDTDTFDAGLAELHAGKFESTFGPRPDEKAMRRKRINIRRHVAGSFF